MSLFIKVNIPFERESLLYRKFINELDTYLGTNDKSYYVDLNTGLINDSHLTFMNNDTFKRNISFAKFWIRF